MRFATVLRCLPALVAGWVLLSVASAATALTYQLVPIGHVSGFSASGSITTDGTLGDLASTNITAWSILLDDGAGTTITLDESNSSLTSDGIFATATDLSFDGSKPNAFDREELDVGNGAGSELDLEYSVTLAEYSEFMRIAGTSSRATFPDPTLPQVFAAVPEPTTTALAALALTAFVAARRR